MKNTYVIKPAFTLLEYFYVLLKSVERASDRKEVFELFKVLKHQYRLGESKYKTVVKNPKELTKAQEDKYLYTFNGVIDEAREYGLVRKEEDRLSLSPEGLRLVQDFDNQDLDKFHMRLFGRMEQQGSVFRKLIESIYSVSTQRPVF